MPKGEQSLAFRRKCYISIFNNIMVQYCQPTKRHCICNLCDSKVGSDKKIDNNKLKNKS